MSGRGTELRTKARRQLDEMAGFLGTVDEADLGKPCPDTFGHGAGGNVGAAAAHMAEGYHLLGQLLQTTGYVPGSPATGHGRRQASPPTAVDLPHLLNRLSSGKVAIDLLAELSDEQLDSVPAAGGRFSDGRRTLERVIDAVIDHQAAHLETLKRAVA